MNYGFGSTGARDVANAGGVRRLWIGLLIVGLLGCAAPEVRSRRTPDYRPLSYGTIGPGDPARSPFGRASLEPEVDALVWDTMKIQFLTRRWDFADVRGTDLLVYWGTGPSERDRGDRIDAGTLVVDIVERETGRRVWYGYAPGVVPKTQDELTDVISRLLLAFPTSGRRPVAY